MLGTTDRTRVRRGDRAVGDRSALHAILDEALVCHVGFAFQGSPVVLPTIHARAGERLYLHGSTGGRMMRTLAAGTDVCVTVTLLDGLVLARSAFHHSMNYRSAVVFGAAEPVTDRDERLAALRQITEQVAPGRWETLRPVTERELAATAVVAVALDEASVKVRTGPPVDDEDDYALPIWAGVLPLGLVPGAPVDDPRLVPGVAVPPQVTAYRR